jgi:hypothetical protein
MQIKLTVPARYIAVLKLFAAEKDMRSYLNGICLEIGRTETRLIATNGHILGVFRVESEQPDIDEPVRNVIIPNDMLKHIKPKGDVDIVLGDVLPDSHAWPVTLSYDGLTVSGETVDGHYPDWQRKFLNLQPSGIAAQFNTEYIGKMGKAWACLHGKRSPLVAIAHNGDSAALIGLDDINFCGVIMPIRTHFVAVPACAPDWVTGAGSRAVEKVELRPDPVIKNSLTTGADSPAHENVAA